MAIFIEIDNQSFTADLVAAAVDSWVRRSTIHHSQAIGMPILSCCTILDILQQQQCKLFLRQRHIFAQHAEVDLEDEMDHSFQLERLFALEDAHFVFLYVWRTFKVMYFVLTIKVR